MSIAFVDSSSLGDSAARTSYLVPKPPCSIGELIVMQIGTEERITGFSALIKNDGDIASFTDLLTDGFTSSGVAYQYVLTPSSGARKFWWVGWKIADAGDAAGGFYTVNIESAGSIGSDRCKADAVSYSGATGVSSWAAQSLISGGVISSITCPDAGDGVRYFDIATGNTGTQAGVSIILTAASGSPLLVCGAMCWFASDHLSARSPLMTREESLMVSVVRDAGAWGEESAPLALSVNGWVGRG